MTDLTNKYDGYLKMNLDELKENAEALNTPATAFDILTIHKSLSHINQQIEEIKSSLVVTITNGSKKQAKISDVVLEIYETQKLLRIRKMIGSYIKENVTIIRIMIMLTIFIVGIVFGEKIDFSFIKNLF